MENYATLYHAQNLILSSLQMQSERKTRKVLENNKGKYPQKYFLSKEDIKEKTQQLYIRVKNLCS